MSQEQNLSVEIFQFFTLDSIADYIYDLKEMRYCLSILYIGFLGDAENNRSISNSGTFNSLHWILCLVLIVLGEWIMWAFNSLHWILSINTTRAYAGAILTFNSLHWILREWESIRVYSP